MWVALGAFLLPACSITLILALGHANGPCQCQWGNVQVHLQSSDPLPALKTTAAPSIIIPVPLGQGFAFSREDWIPAACCKVCRKGKACRDSCIKKSYTCTKPPGCACDGEQALGG